MPFDLARGVSFCSIDFYQTHSHVPTSVRFLIFALFSAFALAQQPTRPVFPLAYQTVLEYYVDTTSGGGTGSCSKFYSTSKFGRNQSACIDFQHGSQGYYLDSQSGSYNILQGNWCQCYCPLDSTDPCSSQDEMAPLCEWDYLDAPVSFNGQTQINGVTVNDWNFKTPLLSVVSCPWRPCADAYIFAGLSRWVMWTSSPLLHHRTPLCASIRSSSHSAWTLGLLYP